MSEESDHSMDVVSAALQKAGVQIEKIELDIASEGFMPTYFKGLMSTSMYALFDGLDKGRDLFSSYMNNLFVYAGKLSPQD